jgi:hypothetical protein
MENGSTMIPRLSEVPGVSEKFFGVKVPMAMLQLSG